MKAGGVASGESGLVAQARGGPDVAVPAEVKAWRQQVQMLYQQGKFNEAIPLQQQDLAWTEKTYGPDHLDTATSLNNLAELYRSQGAYAKAEPLLLRSLAIWEKALGLDHSDTAQSLNNLAFLYFSQGAYAKAEPLYLC
ncbi:MAG: tetratricopeptide repeat-containing protein, partial [Cyanobium sp.]